MTKIIFEVTEENLDTGLRGYPVGHCLTSRVDPMLGLYYYDKPIRDLAHLQPEEVIYFLMEGELKKGEGFESFCRELHKRAPVSKKVIDAILALPKEMHPMHLFVSSLVILGALEGTGDYPEDCLNIIAKAPEIVATIINHHGGWGKTPKSQPELGYMKNFAAMIRPPSIKDPKKLEEALRLFNILHYDHGGGNLSTFVGKAVASSLESMYGSLASAMCALNGPRHGRANQDCLVFLQEVLHAVGENATGDTVEELIRNRLLNKELVFGFGHAVLRVEDSRATIFYEAFEKLFPNHPYRKIANFLRERGPKVLKENPKIQNPYPNVDAVSGAFLAASGFDYPYYFTLLFGLSRIVGIARQIVYERCEAREGKGVPIYRPKYIYAPHIPK
ncbi:MAG: citrate (Si)-synthase [Verrucomicrobia bacterium]|nr:citrate (Si)-synthase [Verrucomicrobiota bacterium]